MLKNKVSLGIFAALTLILIPLQTSALSGADWNAGRIIDDSVFYNKSSMSVQQIQDFLNAKVPNCDRNGTKPSEYGGGTRAQYGASQGAPAPYTCLKDYHENPTTHENNLEGRGIPSGGISAAQIIYDAAQQYNINPQALIVLLQKEQTIVTDEWPFPVQYRSAAGYGCPDSTPGVCNSSYHGFYNQVHKAAWQFRVYANNPNGYNHVANQNNNIRYNPSASCGTSSVFIQNQATASLYNYTPYQPNATALSNIYGSQDDGCGAYGNRNFWRTFTDWFGSTYGVAYAASYYSQSAYPTLKQGEQATITIRYKNEGNLTWYDTSASGPSTYPVVLAASNPVNRGSEFSTPAWSSASRPLRNFSAVHEANGTTLAPSQHVAAPGQIVSYTFPVKAPIDIYVGQYKEYFMPIREGAPGASWFMGADAVHMAINVQRATSAAYQYQSAYPNLGQNEHSSMYFVFKNTGSTVWYDETTAAANNDYPVVLSTAWPMNRASEFATTGWSSVYRPVTRFSKVFEADGVTLAANQHAASPGQIVRFEFDITAKLNQQPGVYREYFTLIRQGARDWPIDGGGGFQDVTVRGGFYRAGFVGQSNYPTVQKGQSGTMSFRLKNTGTLAWYDDSSWKAGIFPVHFATSWPINRGSLFNKNWPTSSRPVKMFTKVYEANNSTLATNQHIVQPGQIAEFSFPIDVPANAASGTYNEYFQPVLEYAPGWQWHMEGIVWQSVIVP